MGRIKKLRTCRKCHTDIMSQPYRDKYCHPCREIVRKEVVERTKLTTKAWYGRNREEWNKERRNHRKDNPDHYRELESHRGERHPLYGIWLGIKTRCYNPNSDNYKDYGARGITMCDRWKNSFEAFVSDIGDKPEGKHSGGRSEYSVERKDVNGNYEPGNCCWATAKEQQNNLRVHLFYNDQIPNDALLHYDNRWVTISQFSELSGVDLKVVKYRYAQHANEDWILHSDVDNRYYRYKGHNYNLTELSFLSHVKYKTLHARIVVNGWSVDRAMEP